ncbi:hypothetical protein [Nannocystis radixulma]|uniref:Lipoprotein n=1 Tax=Nannocystis radixulma TaxID=2995305 RepID=A0ABT5B9E1_9BACT|nr:hypothetical protein [Nannocystis radixulma]MDC0670755.1 hypothetical protein [Nannocystis radixulma]
MPQPLSRMRWPGMLALGTAGVVTACHEEIELDGLDVVPEFSQPICGGTLDKMQQRLDWLVQVTGVPRADRPIRFYWTPHDSGGGCGEGSTCVDRRGRVYSTLELFSHELVHAHLHRYEEIRPWLNEGLAFMLEDNAWPAPATLLSPSELLAVERPEDLDYLAAGSFVRFLREEYGMERLMRLYALSEDTTYAQARAVFEAALGNTFEEVSARYAELQPTAPVGSPDCDYPMMVRDGDGWRRRFRADCDDPDSIGPYFGLTPGLAPYLEAAAVFEVENAGTYEVEARGANIRLSVVSCDLSRGQGTSGTDVAVTLFLEAGRHRVTVDADIDPPQDVDVVVQPQAAGRAAL